MPKRIMEEHQEPVQRKLGTKAVIEPTLYLWRVQFIYYTKEPSLAHYRRKNWGKVVLFLLPNR